MRGLIAWVLLAGCSDELSYGRLLSPDAAAPLGCAARGPREAVGDGDPACASAGFHHALCSCDDFVSGATTEIEGSLALNGSFHAGGAALDTLIIGGINGSPLVGDLTVRDLLLDRGPLQGNHAVTLGDARIAGDVRLDSLRVNGTLTLASDAALEVDQGAPGNVVRAPVTVNPPCNCTPSFDVGARIDAARSSNDNASIGLEPTLGLRTFDGARALTLPCGSYYVDQIYAARPITLHVTGRVALYVDQRIVSETAGGLTIDVAPSAELDVYLRLGITAAGPTKITGTTRLYVGGDDSLFFAGPVELSAELYAPRSELVTQNRFELFGAALVRRAVAERELVAHYPRSLDGCAY